MTKENFYVFTGAPGAGKTTLLKALEQRGIPHIAETAREVIKERLANNLSPRPDAATFAKALFEKDISNFIDKSRRTGVLLFDRSFMDSAAMIKDADGKHFEEILPLLSENRFNKKVFIAPPYAEIYTTDNERDQTFEEAVRVYNKMHDWYTAWNYELLMLPRTSVDERVESVLATIYRLQND